MVSLKHYFRFLGFALLLSLLAACGQPPGSTVSAELEEQVDWIIGNIFRAGGSGPAAIIDLSVTFQDPNIELTDLETAIITNTLIPGQQWTFSEDELENYFFTLDSGKRGLSFSLRSDDLTANGSAIYLGIYTIEVELKNGKRSSKSLVTPAPGSLSSDGYNYTYSPEDYLGTPPSDYVALPRRATIGATALNTTDDTLTINFSVTDDRVYSGWLVLRDANNEFLGYVGEFQDFETRTAHPKLNGGSSLLTDGTTNTLTLAVSDIQVSSEVSDFSLEMVKNFSITLSDGKQYLGTDSTFNTYSVSFGTVQ